MVLYPISSIKCTCPAYSTISTTQNCLSYPCTYIGYISFQECVDHGEEKEALCLDDIVYSQNRNYKEGKFLFHGYLLYIIMDF